MIFNCVPFWCICVFKLSQAIPLALSLSPPTSSFIRMCVRLCGCLLLFVDRSRLRSWGCYRAIVVIVFIDYSRLFTSQNVITHFTRRFTSIHLAQTLEILARFCLICFGVSNVFNQNVAAPFSSSISFTRSCLFLICERQTRYNENIMWNILRSVSSLCWVKLWNNLKFDKFIESPIKLIVLEFFFVESSLLFISLSSSFLFAFRDIKFVHRSRFLPL